MASERVGADCDTGIETWLSQGEFGWTSAGLRLLKLHGSINWVLKDEPVGFENSVVSDLQGN